MNHPSDSPPIYGYPYADLSSLSWIHRNNLNGKKLALLEKLNVRPRAALGGCVTMRN